MTSPEVNIEPFDFVGSEGCAQVLANALLPEAAGSNRHCFSNCCPQFLRKTFELLMSFPVDANASTLHTI